MFIRENKSKMKLAALEILAKQQTITSDQQLLLTPPLLEKHTSLPMLIQLYNLF